MEEMRPKLLRASRASPVQIEALIKFMTLHEKFAAGKFLGKEGKCGNDRLWEKLTVDLNALIGAEKTMKQWKVVWRDLKSSVSQKASKRRNMLSQTGNKDVVDCELTPNDLKVLSVIGNDYAEGLSVPENIPDDETEQVLIESGSTSPTFELPIVVSIDDNISPDETNGGQCLSLWTSIPCVSGEAHEEQNGDKASSSTMEIRQDVPSTSYVTEPLATKRKAPLDKNVRKRPRRESIGSTLETARLNFTQAFDNQTKYLQMLAEAAKMQAEAAKVQADTSMKLAEAAMIQAETERRRVDMELKMTDVLKMCLETLQSFKNESEK